MVMNLAITLSAALSLTLQEIRYILSSGFTKKKGIIIKTQNVTTGKEIKIISIHVHVQVY